MTTATKIQVNANELESALEFVSSAQRSRHSALISVETGRIWWSSTSQDIELEELPDDIDDATRYIAVPHKNELGLGRELVFDFVDLHMPTDGRLVSDYFSRRGAFRQFRQLLERRRMLEQWYEFQNQATRKALREWCEVYGIQQVGE